MSAQTKLQLPDFSIGVGSASISVLPTYFPRNFLLIANQGPGACAVSVNDTAAALNSAGSIQLASGARMFWQRAVPRNAINAISASTSNLTVISDDTGLGTGGLPFWLLNGNNPPFVDLDFVAGRYFNGSLQTTAPITMTRATTNATNLIPTSASGFAFSTFGANVPRITSGLGLLVEDARTNQLFPSTAPSTQTTPSLGTGTYTLWVNGSGSATASVGTATAAALPLVSTQGVPQTFAITVAGTIVVTVAGSLNAFQLELGAFGTSLIVTTGVAAARNGEVGTVTTAPTFGSQFSYYSQGTSFINTSAAQDPFIISMSDGTANNYSSHELARASGKFADFLVVGAVTKFNSTIGASNVIGVSAKFASAVADADQNDVTGASSLTHAITPIFVPTQIDFRRAGTAQTWNGYVERIAVWPTQRLSNAILASLTT